MAVPVALLGQLAGAGIQYFGQKKLLEDQQRMANQRLAGAQADEAAARQGLDTTRYSVAPALREAYAMSKQDPAADALRANQQRQEAQSLEALKASGPRGLAMMNQVADQQAQARAGIEADSYKRQMDAAQTFGGQQQTVNNMNIGDQRALLEHDFGRAQGFSDTYQSYGDQLGVGQQQLLTNTLSGLASNVIPGIADMASMNYVGGQRQRAEGGKIEAYGGTAIQRYARGGAMGGNPFREGGELPGEFSHKSNPISIARKGAAVADYEATGGETILNPEQSGKIEVLASKGDSPLHQYVRELFRKFNSK